jgi:hypothetical protein
MRQVGGDLIVFVHQDVFLPAGWCERFRQVVCRLSNRDPNWGVLGVFGVSRNSVGVGWLYCTGTGRVVGKPFSDPEPVRTLDEVLLVVRRSSRLSFDECLPGFHLYGTDLCLEAARRGMRSYVVPCPVVHNSVGIGNLPVGFWIAYRSVRRKWWNQLPIRTPCTVIERWPLGAALQILSRFVRYSLLRHKVGQRVQNPAILYKELVAARSLPILASA